LLASRKVELEQAIRTRRTHKAYGSQPVPAETLAELFELARWAPNNHLTNPWRSAAHGRGLAGYWRTPEVLSGPEGRAAVGVSRASARWACCIWAPLARRRSRRAETRPATT
jgi:Nitroreductase family